MTYRDPHAGLLQEGVTPVLAQVVFNRLFSERRSLEGDQLPSGDKATSGSWDRGGWWGDSSFGSRLWILIRRGRLNDETLRLAESYTTEALQPLITKGIISGATATASYRSNAFGKRDGITLEVEVVKPDGTSETYHYDDLWNEIGG